ncbi:hypothetical protein ACX8XP_18165 [Calditrichota bacterium LG25]
MKYHIGEIQLIGNAKLNGLEPKGNLKELLTILSDYSEIRLQTICQKTGKGISKNNHLQTSFKSQYVIHRMDTEKGLGDEF